MKRHMETKFILTYTQASRYNPLVNTVEVSFNTKTDCWNHVKKIPGIESKNPLVYKRMFVSETARDGKRHTEDHRTDIWTNEEICTMLRTGAMIKETKGQKK